MENQGFIINCYIIYIYIYVYEQLIRGQFQTIRCINQYCRRVVSFLSLSTPSLYDAISFRLVFTVSTYINFRFEDSKGSVLVNDFEVLL